MFRVKKIHNAERENRKGLYDVKPVTRNSLPDSIDTMDQKNRTGFRAHGPSLAGTGELGLLSMFRKKLSGHDVPGVLQGIGDDCAVVHFSADEGLLVTTDTLVQDVHFRLDYTTPYLLGKKTVAVNLSDVAAMGGTPTYAFLNFAAPKEMPLSFARSFLQGMDFWCKRQGVAVIGGDTVSSPTGVVLTLTLLGRGPQGRIVFRSGAQEGDHIFVSGCLGDAAAGLAALDQGYQHDAACRGLVRSHLDPVPQLELGKYLADEGLASAMIDLSDGLATDLAHVAEESSVGAEVYADKIPVSRACRKLAERLGRSPLVWALSGGEDYHLLFTVPQNRVETILKRPEGVPPLFPVGRIVKGRGVSLWQDGRKTDITYKGFSHFGNGLP